MNQNRRKISEYWLVIDTAFLSTQEHRTSSRDIIGGTEPLVVDILRFWSKR